MNEAPVEVDGKNSAGGNNVDESTAPLKSLISVIVPIYNVEKYVRKCLDSLVNQTMKQIEVIAIDDGSTDESGKIADEYENMDGWPVIRVIHTENRGLSAARNRGIDEARSEWLMFVDSDDWVDERFCEIPWKVAQEYGADMVIFQDYEATENGKEKRKKTTDITGIIDHETAIDIGGSAAWRRLCIIDLFTNLRYPEGHVFEDSAITHHLVYRANRIASIENRLYYYRYRRGSITHSLSREKDRLEMNKVRYLELIEYGYSKEKAKAGLLGAALRCFGRSDRDSGAFQEAVETLKSVTEVPRYLTAKEKHMLKIWNISASLYRIIYRVALRSRT